MERKNAKPRIGLTARRHRKGGHITISEKYIRAVERAGGLPFVIPFGDLTNADSVVTSLDGLMLTGGEDIDPTLLKNAARQDHYDYCPERDIFEIELAKKAFEEKIPVLGICRGCQILYITTGQSLISDIPECIGTSVVHRVSLAEPSIHGVRLSRAGKVAAAYGQHAMEVTSYHHQGLSMQGERESCWIATAWSDDGLVEAIEHCTLPWVVGLLWHPELPVDADRADPLIRDFITTASLRSFPLLPAS